MKHLEILLSIKGNKICKFLFFIIFTSVLNINAQVKRGDSIPNFELYNQSSKWIESNKFKTEKGVVFFFFDGEENKKNIILEAYAKKYNLFKNLDVKVVGICEDVIANINSMHVRKKIPFDILSDSRGMILEKFGLTQKKLKSGSRGLTFVVKNGKIVYIANIKENIDNQIYSALGEFINTQ